MNILLVNNHPMTVEGLISALLQVNFNKKKVVFTKAHDGKEGYLSIIEAYETFHPFDLAIIVQSLPAYPEQSIT